MEPDNNQYQIYSYPDIFFKYFFQEDIGCTRICPEHVLIFIFSGELIVNCGKRKVTVGKGEYIFLKKNINLMLTRKSCKGESFHSVFMGFSRSFLSEFYRNMDKKNIPGKAAKFKKCIIELPKKPHIESLYISLLPYLKWNVKPIWQIMEIKLMEAVFGLLITDKKFYSCLFDLHSIKKQNIYNFTVYSFPPFYKKFMQTTQLISRQWIITKETETTYIKMQQEGEATDIYMEISYKDIVHFRKDCKNPYRFSPLN